MGFTESVRSVFGKYATFGGRATRSEYWYFALFSVIVNFGITFACIIVGGIVGGMDGMVGAYSVASVLTWIYTIATFVPGMAVGVRRLHDTGRSGWNLLWALLPLVGAIVLLVFCVTDSTGDNRYGPRPA